MFRSHALFYCETAMILQKLHMNSEILRKISQYTAVGIEYNCHYNSIKQKQHDHSVGLKLSPAPNVVILLLSC